MSGAEPQPLAIYLAQDREIAAKPQSNGPLYSNTVIGTLAVDERAVTFGTAMRGLDGLWSPVPSSLYQM